MTIEEKRNEIERYCNQKLYCTCHEEYPCPLFDIVGLTGDCYDVASDTEIERNFKLVSAMPDYKGKKEEDELVEEVKVDMVNHPPHYNNGGMETIDEMILIFGEEAVANYCICNAWKYRARALYKNQDEDMKKSHWYINKYKELMGV